MKPLRETSQTMQRVKVGMIGLASIILLIGLASAIIGSATRERPIAGAGAGAGAARPSLTADMTASNMTAPNVAVAGEPLVEMGVAPSANTQAPTTR